MNDILLSGGIVTAVVQAIKSGEWPKNPVARKWLSIIATAIAAFVAGFGTASGTDGTKAVAGVLAVLAAFGIYHGSKEIPGLSHVAEALDKADVIDRVRKFTAGL